MRTGRRHTLKWIALAFFGVLVAFVGGFVVWASTTPAIGPLAKGALESTSAVRVDLQDGVSLTPANPDSVGVMTSLGGAMAA